MIARAGAGSITGSTRSAFARRAAWSLRPCATLLQPRGASVPLPEKSAVLVVEENAVIRSADAKRLRVAGFEVLEAANSAEAELILKSTTVDALVVPVRRG